MMMNDNAKAASILRQYAGELYQGHTIGGEWDGEHIKAEHDELIALADRLALAQRGEAVADSGKMWSLVRSRVQGIHSRLRECNTSAEFSAALDSYSHVLVEELMEKFAGYPDSDRVAELEAELAESRELEGWMPIETAPPDTEILIGAFIDGEWHWGRSVRFYESANEFEGETFSGWVWSIDDVSESVAESPTHWRNQPLPPAPSVDGEG